MASTTVRRRRQLAVTAAFIVTVAGRYVTMVTVGVRRSQTAEIVVVPVDFIVGIFVVIRRGGQFRPVILVAKNVTDVETGPVGVGCGPLRLRQFYVVQEPVE